MSDDAYVGPPRLSNVSCDVRPPHTGKQAHCVLNLNLEDRSSSSDGSRHVKLELTKSNLDAVISSLEKVKTHFDTIAGHQTTKTE